MDLIFTQLHLDYDSISHCCFEPVISRGCYFVQNLLVYLFIVDYFFTHIAKEQVSIAQPLLLTIFAVNSDSFAIESD